MIEQLLIQLGGTIAILATVIIYMVKYFLPGRVDRKVKNWEENHLKSLGKQVEDIQKEVTEIRVDMGRHDERLKDIERGIEYLRNRFNSER